MKHNTILRFRTLVGLALTVCAALPVAATDLNDVLAEFDRVQNGMQWPAQPRLQIISKPPTLTL